MLITDVEATQLFVASPNGPRQLIRVSLAADGAGAGAGAGGGAAGGAVVVEVTGDGMHGLARAQDHRQGQAKDRGQDVVEVPVETTQPPGTPVQVRVTAGPAGSPPGVWEGALRVAEPGWTIWMISHFHYDPVWWNTQAAFTATWDKTASPASRYSQPWQEAGFTLVDSHLRAAERDPGYKFVLAELDYLKPYWDSRPEQRAVIRRLIGEGRVELVGGMYNEPSTNLTYAETTIRSLVYGSAFQRDVLGGDPATAWMLDVFGHDPQFPGLAAEAGLTSSSWARGPFHQWGPMLSRPEFRPDDGWGDASVMEFPSEFEWIAPSGRGVLTHYMPAHYSAGWSLESATSLPEAERRLLDLSARLAEVASTRNILLPVGTDYSPPATWALAVQQHWSQRYVWPRVICGLPREFFAAVRRELDDRGVRPSPQTRDMNPVYTGKEVTYVDTKQANRHAEALTLDAEKFATIASLHGAAYPWSAMDKSWRQLLYAAHHDALPGSESDQVYLDLLTTWRNAHDLSREVLERSLEHLASRVETAPDAVTVVVFNPCSWPRSDIVRVRAEFSRTDVRNVSAVETPLLLEHPDYRPDGSIAEVDLVFLARDVPSLGYRTWRFSPTSEATEAGWVPVEGMAIENEHYLVEVDPARGGGVSRLVDKASSRELIRGGEVGNELVVYDEYPEHPRAHEGPLHISPSGPKTGSAGGAARSVLVERSPIGSRVTVTGDMDMLSYRQVLTLWDGVARLDGRTRIDSFTGSDQLIRLRWPAPVDGALPVSEVGGAVVGRGFAFVGADTAVHPWTLDNPAQHWFALSTTARVVLRSPDGERLATRAFGVAEIVAPDGAAMRDLVTALVRQGVTATVTAADGPRYGNLSVDSNLPDLRISAGAPADNAFTRAVLAAAPSAYAAEFERQLSTQGHAVVWVPPAEPLRDVWSPSADLRGARVLPVLLLAGERARAAVIEDLGDATIEVSQPRACTEAAGAVDPEVEDYTVGIVHRGTPGFAVEPDGTLHLSLMRSCTGWASGVFVDQPARRTPDGTSFQLQHWSHDFDYSVVGRAGDWRRAGLVPLGYDVNHPLRAKLASTAAGTMTNTVASAVASPEPGAATLPDAASFVQVEPAETVVLAALKPAADPLAAGREPPSEVSALTLRLHESTGSPTTATVQTQWTVKDCVRTDLLDRPAATGARPVRAGEPAEIDLAGMEIASLRQEIVPPRAAPGTEIGSAREPLQPVFTRYWLHNTGPAPLGNLPVAVYLTPGPLNVEGPVTLRLSVASSRTDGDVTGIVRLHPPAGWRAEPRERPFGLGPGGYSQSNVVVSPPADAAPGSYRVRAELEFGGQRYEDVTTLLLGASPTDTASATDTTSLTGPTSPTGPDDRISGAGELSVSLRTESVRLPPGEHGEIVVGLSSASPGTRRAQVQLISPWGSWDLCPEWDRCADIPSAGQADVRFPVRVGPGTEPGRWWALVKVASEGRCWYTEAITIEVTAERPRPRPRP